MPDLPLPLLVALIVLAVVVGLWVGAQAGKRREALQGEGDRKSIGQRAREGATRGMVRLWKWNRARKRKKSEEE